MRSAEQAVPGAGAGASGPPAASYEVVEADVLVVGAGAAGLTAALGCVPRRVVVLTKIHLSAAGGGGASAWAQGGVASAVGDDDDPALHAADTLAAGAGLNDVPIVRLLTGEGPRRIRALQKLGARFDRDALGRLALGREAAHSRRRILHAHGDATGAEVVRTLVAAVRRQPAIQVIDETFAIDLVRVGEVVAGVTALRRDGSRVLFRAPAVVLATGGLGQLFQYTTNPREATADGLAMAARAGARLVDLEFVQFHPTALAAGGGPGATPPGAPLPLLTEALRGEGAILIDDRGCRFMAGVHPDRELAPRDVVARAIWGRLRDGRTAFLDAREAVGERFPERFPTVYALCRQHGIDPRVQPMPVVPAAHYHMGGVAVDAAGRSSLPGLWACGEVAATGAHGANRLASNSLLEALVFGARVAEDIVAVAVSAGPAAAAAAPPEATPAPHPPPPTPPTNAPPATYAASASPSVSGAAGAAGAGSAAAFEPALFRGAEDVIAEVRRILWQEVGLERTGAGLAAAVAQLERLAHARPEGPDEARNLLWVGRLMAQAALARQESRGGHYRSDHPHPEAAWQRRLFLTASPDARARFEAGEAAAAVTAAGAPPARDPVAHLERPA